MMKVTVNGQLILEKCDRAHSFRQRLVGLLSHSDLAPQEALLIEKCKQVHTFFMKFSIDAIFLDGNNAVIGICELKPWKISKYYFKAQNVLETKLGFARKHNIKVGQKLEFNNG